MSAVIEPLVNPPLENSPPPAAVSPDNLVVTVIEARPGWHLIDFHELWRYRELLFCLTWRDIKVRYKQTVLGASWALLQPLAMMVVFTLFLGRVVGTGGDVPYPLYVFTGLLPWLLFSSAVTSAANSVVGNQNLVTKVYFPRLLVPLSAVGTAVIDFLVAAGLLGVLMAWYGVAPGWTILLAPAIVALLVLAAFGVGTLLAALTVTYRDFRHVVPFAVQLWMFATPCIYLGAEALGPNARAWLPLNPAFGLIDNFRRAVLGSPLDLYGLSVSASVALFLLLIGCAYFRRVERSFADVI